MSEFKRIRYNETHENHPDGRRNLNYAHTRACSCAESAVRDIRRGHLSMRKIGHLYSLITGDRLATVQRGKNHRGDEWHAYAVGESPEAELTAETLNAMADDAIRAGAHDDRLYALMSSAYAFGMLVCLARYNSYGDLQIWKDRIPDRDLGHLRRQREYIETHRQ